MSRATGLVGLGIAASALLIRLVSGPGPEAQARRTYDDAYAEAGVWGAPSAGGGLLSLFQAGRARRAAMLYEEARLARAHADDFQDDDALPDDDDDDATLVDDDARRHGDQDPTTLVIEIDGDGALSVDGEDVDDDELGELVAEAGRGGAEVSARVVASDDVDHARVVAVLEALRAHGITRLSIGAP